MFSMKTMASTDHHVAGVLVSVTLACVDFASYVQSLVE
jgi:hypothetical protein